MTLPTVGVPMAFDVIQTSVGLAIATMVPQCILVMESAIATKAIALIEQATVLCKM